MTYEKPKISFAPQKVPMVGKTGGAAFHAPVVVNTRQHTGITFTVSLIQPFGKASMEKGPYTIPAGSSGTKIKCWYQKRLQRANDYILLEITGAVGATVVDPVFFAIDFYNP